MILLSMGLPHTSEKRALASEATSWEAISTIYYDPGQDDTTNKYLQWAAGELESFLEQISGRVFNVDTGSQPPPPAIYLQVNPGVLAGYSDEAFRLQIDSDGIRITGKTAFAARSGTYKLLDLLGVRWLSSSDIWTVVPDTLIDLGNVNQVYDPDFIWREVAFGPYIKYAALSDEIWKTRNLLGGNAAFRISHSYYRFMPPADWWDHPDSYLTASTTLSQNIDVSATEIPVASTSGFPNLTTDTPNPILLVDNEVIRYTARNGTAFTGCTRGYNGTTPANHSTGASVTQIPAPDGQYTGWQIKPDDPYVISQAISWAEQQTTEYRTLYTIDKTPYAVTSISPNDGQSWASYSNKSTQEITDLVCGLANDVATAMYLVDPATIIGVYNYSLYADVPTFDFTGNVYVEAATAYDYTTLTDAERITGLRERGAIVGIREYYDIFQWYEDSIPVYGEKKLKRLKKYAEAGTNVYRAEATIGYGGNGIIYWIASRLMWDASLSIDDLVDEYCTYAFGDAKGPMIRYYKRNMSGQSLSDNLMAGAIADLNEAYQLAAGNDEAQARIRWQAAYNYYLYKRFLAAPAYENMTLEQFLDFYQTFSKLHDWYLLSYNYFEEDTIHDPLRDRWGMSEEQITAWMADNADFIPPTPGEVEGWMGELTNAYSGVSPITAYTYDDPYDMNLKPLNNTEASVLEPSTGLSSEVMVYAQAGDTIECSFITFSPYTDTTFTLYDADNTYIDEVTISQNREWTGHSFTASLGTGIYKITGAGSIDVTSHPAGHVAVNRHKDCVLYFYVPEGTPSFLFEFSGNPDGAEIYGPDGQLEASYSSGGILGVNSPEAGLWYIDFDNNSLVNCVFTLYGIPDLVWHDPNTLLVQDISYINPDVNGDGSVNILDIISVAAHFGETGSPGWIPEDVVNDGVINVLDITYISNHWS